jgi:PKD repeat protein
MRQPVRFAAATFDNWSSVASIGWAFGDGGEGAFGPAVEHTYAAPGTYPISITAADDRANTRSTAGSITIYRLPNAARNVRVRRGVATLMVHCPSPAGCTGVLRLIARVQLERNGRSFGKRAQVGKKQFSIGQGTSPVAVKLTRPGVAALLEAGRKGLRTQLTGPGIQHRLVLLLPARRR